MTRTERLTSTLTASAAALSVAGSLAAGGAAADAPEVVEEQDFTELQVGWILGGDVEDPMGDTIGSIDELILDEDGRITTAVLAIGGWFGFGAKSIAVPYEAFEINHDGHEIVLDTTRDELEAADEFAFRDRQSPPPPDAAPAADPGAPMPQ
jgi:hypothetical protein